LPDSLCSFTTGSLSYVVMPLECTDAMAERPPLLIEGEATLLDQPGRYWGFVLLGPDGEPIDLAQRAAVHFGAAREGLYALGLGRVRVTVELLDAAPGVGRSG